MTTEKLIELAKKCDNGVCDEGCPYYNEPLIDCVSYLLADVTEKLEMAYTELKEQGYCSTCKYNNICSGDGDADTDCNGSDKWEWVGDEE